MAGQADALYVCGDLLQARYRIRINTLALGLRLPTMLASREEVEAAGLMSYGPNFPDLFRFRQGLKETLQLLHLLRSPIGTQRKCRDVRDHGESWRRQSAGLANLGSFLVARRRADRISEQPADIPVEQPTKFDLIINLTTVTGQSFQKAVDVVVRSMAARVTLRPHDQDPQRSFAAKFADAQRSANR
jgi:hypothetical protein